MNQVNTLPSFVARLFLMRLITLSPWLKKSLINDCSRPTHLLLAQLNDQVMIDYLAKLEEDNIIERIKAVIIDQLLLGKTDNEAGGHCRADFSPL